jgi:hypothetical protein
MLNRKNKVLAALGAALAAGAIGGGVAVANAAPPPPPPSPTVIDTPEPGDSPDAEQAGDTDNLQEGDQNGPEVPDTPAAPAPPGG